MRTKTLLTEEEFDQLPEDEGGRYELDEGELVEMPTGNLLHDDVRDESYEQLRAYLRQNPIGRPVIEHEFRLAPEIRRRPDIAFLTNEKRKQIDRQQSPTDAIPDLIIEIISPNDKVQELKRKVNQYLTAGVAEVWLIHLRERQLEIWRGSTATSFGENEEVRTPILPGFVFRLREVLEAA